MFKIISPTGVSVTIPLSEEVATKLKADKWYRVVAMRPRIHVGDIGCESCSA